MDGSKVLHGLISSVSHKAFMALAKNLILQIKKLKQIDDESGENSKELLPSTISKTKPSSQPSIKINTLNKKISYKIWFPHSSVKVRRCVNIYKALVTTTGYGRMATAPLRRNISATISTTFSPKPRPVFRGYFTIQLVEK